MKAAHTFAEIDLSGHIGTIHRVTHWGRPLAYGRGSVSGVCQKRNRDRQGADGSVRLPILVAVRDRGGEDVGVEHYDEAYQGQQA
jgi:hypothetical protein